MNTIYSTNQNKNRSVQGLLKHSGTLALIFSKLKTIRCIKIMIKYHLYIFERYVFSPNFEVVAQKKACQALENFFTVLAENDFFVFSLFLPLFKHKINLLFFLCSFFISTLYSSKVFNSFHKYDTKEYLSLMNRMTNFIGVV